MNDNPQYHSVLHNHNFIITDFQGDHSSAPICAFLLCLVSFLKGYHAFNSSLPQRILKQQQPSPVKRILLKERKKLGLTTGDLCQFSKSQSLGWMATSVDLGSKPWDTCVFTMTCTSRANTAKNASTVYGTCVHKSSSDHVTGDVWSFKHWVKPYQKG